MLEAVSIIKIMYLIEVVRRGPVLALRFLGGAGGRRDGRVARSHDVSPFRTPHSARRLAGFYIPM